MKRAVARLPTDDVDDVLAVEPARVAQEGLLGLVVVLLPVLESPVEAAYGEPGELGLDGPSREGPGALPHVVLGVVAHAHAEQLQQLPAPVLVDRVGVVLVVVQPVDHRRALGQLHQQLPVVSHALLAKHGHHVGYLVVVVHLGDPRGEHLVPEEGHLLFQGPLGVHHVVEPFGGAHALDGTGLPGPGVVPEEVVPVHGGLAGGFEELFHGGVVAPGHPGFQLLPGRSEARPAHEMGHQRDVFVSHSLPPFTGVVPWVTWRKL